MNKPKYNPDGPWEYYDFMVNKSYWEKKGVGESYTTRVENLKLVYTELTEFEIPCWLQGKTLLGVVNEKKLLNDHDDDLGVFIGDKHKIEELVIPRLERLGFKVVRNNEHMISIERDYRYIDICLFRTVKKSKVGYASKVFSEKYFQNFERINFSDMEFMVPQDTQKMIREMYSGLRIRWDKISVSGFLRKAKKIIPYIRTKVLNRASPLPAPILRMFGLNRELLTFEQFLALNIEPERSFNWKWRRKHLSPLTCDGRYSSIEDIIQYLSREEVQEEINRNIIETDTSRIFFDPVNLDMDFWWTGNNYFWYCVKYQFRKNVIPYSEANDYIKNRNEPMLYCSEYYENLDKMSDVEIAKFLEKHPIEIENNAVVGGKHRVFAMIGRILSGENYIPISAIVIND